jgi:hypothetical protein
MAEPRAVDPVKQFVAVLWRDAAALDTATHVLQDHWGPIDVAGPDHPFDATDYYVAEMGNGLQRRLLAFAQLVPPDSLAAAKRLCNDLELRLTANRGRQVNLDVGYLDHNKIVLASVKYAGQKIYLGDGVYADLVARYTRNHYAPFEWTFPDFRDGRYNEELAEMRDRYLSQMRELRRIT